MKKATTLFLLIVAFIRPITGQSFKTGYFNTNSDYHFYLFTDKEFHYFQTLETEIVKVSKVDYKQSKRFKLPFEGDNEKLHTLSHTSSEILMVTETKEEGKVTKYNLYAFDGNGTRLKYIPIDANDGDKHYSLSINFIENKIYILDYKSQSSTAEYAYDFSLNELTDKTYKFSFESFAKELEQSFNAFFDENFNDAFRSFDISEDDSNKPSFVSKNDSDFLEHYLIKYYMKGGSFGRYDHKIENIEIVNRATNLSKSFEIENDKSVLDLCMKELKNGQLLLYGKYIIENSGSRPMYGIFSCLFNIDLKPAGSVRYQELTSVSNNKQSKEERLYSGLALSDLRSPNHIFETDNGHLLCVFQHEFKGYSDFIYILNITPSGEIILNYIANKFEDYDFKTGNREMFQVQMLNNKLHFVFYESEENLSKAVNDGKTKTGYFGKKNNVLAYCTYNYDQDEWSSKTSILSLKDNKDLPSFNRSEFSYDTYSSSYNWFLIGKDKEDHASGVYIINFIP